MWIVLSQNCHARIGSFEYQDRCNLELKSSWVWETMCGPSPERVSKQQKWHSSDQHQAWIPRLPVRQHFSHVLCWDEQVSEEKDNPALDELSGVNHRVISDRKQALWKSSLLLSPQDREEQCACFPLLASLSEILAFYDTGTTCMYRHPYRHVDTCKDIKAHTHSLCLFLLPCRKPWRTLICEHDKTLTIGWRDGSLVRSTHRSDRKSEFSSTATYNISSREVKALLWPLWVLHACAALIVMLTHTRTHTRKNLFKN